MDVSIGIAALFRLSGVLTIFLPILF
jgi:hypothetical protein